ncbi:MAG: PEP-CTERM sorting domain-containing protein, partial [Sedimenticolaceae bacterium]
DAMAGLLTIKGDLTTEADSQIILDVFGLGTGMFDQLLVGGELNLAGTVLFNILDPAMLEEFVENFSLFDLIFGTDGQGKAPQLGDIANATFEAIMANSLTQLLLADDGSGGFTLGVTDPIPDQVPEPGVLVLFCIGLLLLSIQAGRGSWYRWRRV